MIDQKKIHNQFRSDNPEKRIEALNQLEDNFLFLPDKEQTRNDFFVSFLPSRRLFRNLLIKLTNNKYWNRREIAAYTPSSASPQVLDKQEAWNYLHKLTTDENIDVRYKAADALHSVFIYIPDKQQAWNDLIRLCTDKESSVRSWISDNLRACLKIKFGSIIGITLILELKNRALRH